MKKEDFKKAVIREVIEWSKSLAFALVFAAVIFTAARPSVIFGESMQPCFDNHQVVLVEKVSYLHHEPQRQDVVTLKTDFPIEHISWMHKNFIKRVIGIPGDHILIEGGQLFINGELQVEDSINPLALDDYFEGTVPQGHVFVMGDNRTNSSDSRRLGYFPYKDIIGKVYLRFYPFAAYR